MILEPEKFDEVRKVQLEILIEFDRVCKEHDIHYNLHFGTLLGAIRHQGFIPWDDDIDLAMTRENYDKFIDIFKGNLDEKYFVQTYETDPNFFRPYMRIRKNDTVFVQRHYQDLDIHHGVFIDIFPFDSVYEEKSREKKRYKYLTSLRKLNVIKHFGVDEQANIVKKLLQKTIDKLMPQLAFNRYLTKVMTKRNKENLSYINLVADYSTMDNFDKYLIKKDDFLDSVPANFEGHEFPIPRNYEQVLVDSYGDYMQLPPEEERIPHHQVIEIKT